MFFRISQVEISSHLCAEYLSLKMLPQIIKSLSSPSSPNKDRGVSEGHPSQEEPNSLIFCFNKEHAISSQYVRHLQVLVK